MAALLSLTVADCGNRYGRVICRRLDVFVDLVTRGNHGNGYVLLEDLVTGCYFERLQFWAKG